MRFDIIELTNFIQNNSRQKQNVIEFVESKICAFSNSNTDSREIKGMVKILDILKKLSERYYLE